MGRAWCADLMLEVKKNEFLGLENLVPLMEGEARKGESGEVVLGLLCFDIQVEVSHG